MSKKISVGVTIGLMAITAAVTFVITGNVSLELFNKKVRSVGEKQEFYSKLSEADSFARSNYINPIDEAALMDDIVSGYINGLNDPYAAYYTAEQYASLTDRSTGYNLGLGFTWEKDPGGYVKINGVVANSSADEYGLAAGDIIMAVNNTNIIAYPGGYSAAVKLFSAPEGTKVKLHVKRINEEGGTEFLNVDLISAKTEVISVTGRIINNVGYVRISEFNALTASQLESVIGSLTGSGAVGFVFDVRDNEGGTVEALGQTLDVIIPAGEIVRAYYPVYDEPIVVTTDEKSLDAPMTVLINNGTKGEAELFAYALKDEKNAITVGKNTFGKGVIQDTFKCSDGSAVRFSVASLRTKNSGDFTGKGLKPDHDVSLAAEVEPFKLSPSEQDIYDEQLIKALETVSAG